MESVFLESLAQMVGAALPGMGRWSFLHTPDGLKRDVRATKILVTQ